eukprot:1160713-Pelagomonas_calceolata.AAC.4
MALGGKALHVSFFLGHLLDTVPSDSVASLQQQYNTKAPFANMLASLHAYGFAWGDDSLQLACSCAAGGAAAGAMGALNLNEFDSERVDA